MRQLQPVSLTEAATIKIEQGIETSPSQARLRPSYPR